MMLECGKSEHTLLKQGRFLTPYPSYVTSPSILTESDIKGVYCSHAIRGRSWGLNGRSVGGGSIGLDTDAHSSLKRYSAMAPPKVWPKMIVFFRLTAPRMSGRGPEEDRKNCMTLHMRENTSGLDERDPQWYGIKEKM